MKEVICQNCGAVCDYTTDKFESRSELGFMIPHAVYVCSCCNWKHVICPECNGEEYTGNSISIVDDVNCPHCLGEGTVVVDRGGK